MSLVSAFLSIEPLTELKNDQQAIRSSRPSRRQRYLRSCAIRKRSGTIDCSGDHRLDLLYPVWVGVGPTNVTISITATIPSDSTLPRPGPCFVTGDIWKYSLRVQQTEIAEGSLSIVRGIEGRREGECVLGNGSEM